MCSYGIKKWKNDLRADGQSDVTSAESRGLFGDLWLSRFLQSVEEENQCGGCVVSSFASLSPSLRGGVLVCRCRLPSFDFALLSRNLSSIAFFSSDQIKLGWGFFVFYREDHGLTEKLLLIIFIFWQISLTIRYALILCAEAPFSILKKVSASITSGECSRGRSLQFLFCVCDKLEEISFGPITHMYPNANITSNS